MNILKKMIVTIFPNKIRNKFFLESFMEKKLSGVAYYLYGAVPVLGNIANGEYYDNKGHFIREIVFVGIEDSKMKANFWIREEDIIDWYVNGSPIPNFSKRRDKYMKEYFKV